MSYQEFLSRKEHSADLKGFAPTFLQSFLFDFQVALIDWATRGGRRGIFADCGLGKTPMQLVWAQNVVQQTNKHVLIIAPLAASAQTVREGAKFDIPCVRSSTGYIPTGASIVVTNYERLHLFNPHDFS